MSKTLSNRVLAFSMKALKIKESKKLQIMKFTDAVLSPSDLMNKNKEG